MLYNIELINCIQEKWILVFKLWGVSDFHFILQDCKIIVIFNESTRKSFMKAT